MRTGRGRGTALVVTAATLVLAAGCSAGGGAAAPPSVEKPNLTAAVVPSLDSAGFFIALYGGLFRDQGLNVTFVPAVSSETAISAQVNGQYDITAGNYVSYIQAQEGHQPNLDIFAEHSLTNQLTLPTYTMPAPPPTT